MMMVLVLFSCYEKNKEKKRGAGDCMECTKKIQTMRQVGDKLQQRPRSDDTSTNRLAGSSNASIKGKGENKTETENKHCARVGLLGGAALTVVLRRDSCR